MFPRLFTPVVSVEWKYYTSCAVYLHPFPTLLSKNVFVARNWSWWEYLHSGNQQTLQIRARFIVLLII